MQLKRFKPHLPRSLTGQVLLAMAGALLLAQTISAVLLYRAQAEYHREQLVHALALRTSMAMRGDQPPPPDGPPPGNDGPLSKRHHHDHGSFAMPSDEMMRGGRPETLPGFAPLPQDRNCEDFAAAIQQVLADQDIAHGRLLVLERPLAADPVSLRRLARREAMVGRHQMPRPDHVLISAVETKAGGPWQVVRVNVPQSDPWLLATLIAQTLFIYALLVGVMALILRRIARPLAQLTRRLDHFAETRAAEGQIAPQGPQDIRRLIEAHNAMEDRIVALLNEKDVMLGAIGHDLKTPLAALRVRIESVEDDQERDKMAQTIEDIVRSLDDILSLARVGRPSDPLEQSELSALVAQVVEEYEDMGEPVLLGDTVRLVLPLRATWLRRALRNLISNALRYGSSAAVSTERETIGGKAFATIRIVDEGAGIPEADIERLFEPFTRGEPSRNSTTGGAGLGLTLARAIAEQHGGRLTLSNRPGKGGLEAVLRLPLP